MSFKFNPFTGNLDPASSDVDHSAGFYNIPIGGMVFIEVNKISLFKSFYTRSGYIKRAGFKKRSA
jgi:hypothetical protein